MSIEEKWEYLPNYEGLYKVSNYGKIFDCLKNEKKSLL